MHQHLPYSPVTLAALCILGIVPMGCTTVSSENLLSKGISVEIDVGTSPDTTDAALQVTFRDGLNYVQLTGNDSVLCESKGLVFTSTLGVGHYRLTVPKKKAGETYTCVVKRGTESTPFAVKQVADLFLTDPPPATWSKEQASLTIKATPVGATEELRATISSDCVNTVASTAERDPVLSFARSGLTFNNLKDGESCKAQVVVSNSGTSKAITAFKQATLTSRNFRESEILIQR